MANRSKTNPSTRASTSKLPAWITSHFQESLDALDLLMNMIRISQRGIRMLRAVPNAIQVLSSVNGAKADSTTDTLIKRAEEEAALAHTEVEKDFPVLHGFAAVALWSWLEHFVKGFIALWLMHRRESLETPAVQKLRVKLGDYLKLQKAEQAQLLVELLEQDLASPLKRGAARFESLLEPFGLRFSLPEKCGFRIFELQQVRNAIAHRNGKADRRLRASCPLLKLKLGQPVSISRSMLENYAEAAGGFLLELLYRIGDIYNEDLRPADPTSVPNGVAVVKKG